MKITEGSKGYLDALDDKVTFSSDAATPKRRRRDAIDNFSDLGSVNFMAPIGVRFLKHPLASTIYLFITPLPLLWRDMLWTFGVVLISSLSFDLFSIFVFSSALIFSTFFDFLLTGTLWRAPWTCTASRFASFEIGGRKETVRASAPSDTWLIIGVNVVGVLKMGIVDVLDAGDVHYIWEQFQSKLIELLGSIQANMLCRYDNQDLSILTV